ncbi:hypothetical protein [Fodinibius halophilus]|uniref:Uncharacterized protein n=1 Tax=Fodinibius halophilus TaxID=1736908 RepID=A0A6M1T3X2_9BACT|nr:hypothetical protein [Fodinibius halophilus]NGP87353.1 hypothetical protein [Fodinibius halophilus]
MGESILQPDHPEVQGEEFQKLLEMVRDMMGELHHTASTSVELNQLDITNEWAETIKKGLGSPVISNFQALKSIEESIINMMQEQFIEFIQTKSHLIDSAYIVSENSLHYAIVLKEDTINNEGEILEFKMDYDDTPISQRFPLVISFPSKEHLEDASLSKELTVG